MSKRKGRKEGEWDRELKGKRRERKGASAVPVPRTNHRMLTDTWCVSFRIFLCVCGACVYVYGCIRVCVLLLSFLNKSGNIVCHVSVTKIIHGSCCAKQSVFNSSDSKRFLQYVKKLRAQASTFLKILYLKNSSLFYFPSVDFLF